MEKSYSISVIRSYFESRIVKCSCGEVITKDISHEYINEDGEVSQSCESCLEDETCAICGRTLFNYSDEDCCVEVKEEYICQRCIRKYEISYTQCYNCDEHIITSYPSIYSSIVGNFSQNFTMDCNGDAYCENCEDNLWYCEDCEEYHHCNEDSYYISSLDRTICEECYTTGDYRYCEYCGETVVGHCECGLEYEILDYSYKREDVTFFGRDNDQFFGVELEIETKNIGDRGRIINIIRDYFDSNDCWFTYDGSLKRGFEIVFAPRTLKNWKSIQDALETMMEELVNADCNSHYTDTCGLHVHVNRSSVEDRIKLVSCVRNIWKKEDKDLTKLTRRKRLDLFRWANPECPAFKRESFVNTLPSKTIECRGFKGTLKVESFIAAIEFYNELINHCADVQCLQDIYNVGSDNLKAYMKKRIPSLQEVKEKEKV